MEYKNQGLKLNTMKIVFLTTKGWKLTRFEIVNGEIKKLTNSNAWGQIQNYMGELF